MKVKPVKVKRVLLSRVSDGALFTLGGRRYIKLENDFHTKLLAATTVDPVANIATVFEGDTDVNNRVMRSFCDIKNIATENECIRACFLMTPQNLLVHGNRIYPHVQDEWYIKAEYEDKMRSGEYLYVDKFCNVEKGNAVEEQCNGTSKKLGIRLFYGIDKNAIVTVAME